MANAPKADAPKVEAKIEPKIESKLEAPKVEAPKVEAKKPEVPRIPGNVTIMSPGDRKGASAKAEAEPSGKRIRWEGMDVIPFEDGKVKRKDVYSDSVSILGQVGLL